MDIQSVITLLVGVALAGILIAAGVIAERKLSAVKPTTPGESAIIATLQKWILTGVAAGERVALDAFTSLNKVLTDADKKAVADRIYALLPQTLEVEGHSIPIGLVKSLISQERFEALVESGYEELHAFILSNEDYLKQGVAKLTDPNAAPGALATKTLQPTQKG